MMLPDEVGSEAIKGQLLKLMVTQHIARYWI
jgi:hypothetical protein